MTELRAIAISQVDTGKRLRSLDRDWVATLAESMAANGQQSPIEVVLAGDRYRLVFGAHRLAAARLLGWDSIGAVVKPATDLSRDIDERLREIAENLVRRELTVLDHAVHVGTWREIYNSINPVPKPGPKKKLPAAEIEEEISARFCTSFSEAAQRAMGISRRAVFYALKIASIDPALRDRLANHAIADNQSELLALAGEPAKRQAQIVALLTAETAEAQTVAEAIAIIDELPAPVALRPHERLSETFSRLKPEDRNRFFELHIDDIDRWRAARGK